MCTTFATHFSEYSYWNLEIAANVIWEYGLMLVACDLDCMVEQRPHEKVAEITGGWKENEEKRRQADVRWSGENEWNSTGNKRQQTVWKVNDFKVKIIKLHILNGSHFSPAGTYVQVMSFVDRF